MTEAIMLGEDLGMGANKLWGAAGGLQIVSQVSSNGGRQISEGMVGLRSHKRPMMISSEWGSFYAGDGAHEYGRPVENLDFERLTGAPEMRALVYAGWAQYLKLYGSFGMTPATHVAGVVGTGLTPIRLMVGLPLQMMVGAQAKAYQAGVRNWLKGVHTFEADGVPHQVEVAQVRLTSQPVGALFDYVLDGQGQIQPERAEAMLDEVGVISVGFNTLELLVVKDQGAVERFTSGATSGVRRLLELMNRDSLYSLGELDGLLRTGRLHSLYDGRQLKQAMPIWAREVNGEIEKRWGQSFKRFVRVLIVGGGAMLLKEALTAQFGAKAWVPNEPVMSIARGLWKLSVMKR